MKKKTSELEFDENASNEIDEPSNYAKGEEFEIEFANFLKKNLGYEKTIVRRNVPSADNGKGTNVDVIGFKTDPRGTRIYNLGLVYTVLAVVVIAIKAIYTLDSPMDTALSTVISVVAIITLLAGIYCLYSSKNYQSENAWVECKNRKAKATHSVLTTMYEQYRSYEKLGNSKYKFTELFFVSANGFVDNALEFAKQKNIRCFVKDTKGKFVELSL